MDHRLYNLYCNSVLLKARRDLKEKVNLILEWETDLWSHLKGHLVLMKGPQQFTGTSNCFSQVQPPASPFVLFSLVTPCVFT